MWLAGFAAHAALTMFYQDWLGLEGYIEMVRNQWIHLHPVIPFSLMIGNLYWAWAIYRGPK